MAGKEQVRSLTVGRIGTSARCFGPKCQSVLPPIRQVISLQGSLDNQLAEQARLTAPPVLATEPSTFEAGEAALLAESPRSVTAGPDGELSDPQLSTDDLRNARFQYSA